MSILGDMGTVEADGTIVFLGRGSQCINTGGEKVFAEEVEAVLHAHPAIADALVVPVPDAKYGQRVAAVAKIADGVDEPTEEELQDHVRASLAGYKVPRTIVFVDEVKRTPCGQGRLPLGQTDRRSPVGSGLTTRWEPRVAGPSRRVGSQARATPSGIKMCGPVPSTAISIPGPNAGGLGTLLDPGGSCRWAGTLLHSWGRCRWAGSS